MAYFFNTSDINQTFIIQPLEGGDEISGCTLFFQVNVIAGCGSNSGTTMTFGEKIVVNSDILPETDNSIDLGYSGDTIQGPSGTTIENPKRFRELNTYGGTSTVWRTDRLELGMDNPERDQYGALIDPRFPPEFRYITADNSIIQDDILNGGEDWVSP